MMTNLFLRSGKQKPDDTGLKGRSNQEWLADLRGPLADEAISELRTILLRGLQAALRDKIRQDLNPIIEDFVQEALIKILRNLHTFRGESHFTTWAQKIAVHVAYTELRRRRWRDVSLQNLIENQGGHDFTPALLTAPEATPEQKATQHAMLEFVQRLIDEELTERQRQAMTAVMIMGIPIAEVARRMNTNRNALYKLLHDARRRLRRSMLARGVTPQDVLAAFK
jgi:RNA polymerase sigma-70 factor (ECF subfamily)